MGRFLLSFLAVGALFIGASPRSHASIGAGLSFGSPFRLGAKAVAHPKESLWGGQLTFASNGEGLDAVTLLRADARYAFSQDDLRLYAYFGFNYIDGKVSSRAAAAVPSLEGGGGVEVRWVPGAGFSFEMGPMIAFSGDPNVSMLGFYFDFSVIIWTDLW